MTNAGLLILLGKTENKTRKEPKINEIHRDEKYETQRQSLI